MMKPVFLMVCVLVAVSLQAASGNLLSNAGFETQGSSANTAQNWEWGTPDIHGSFWGTASRESWRTHSGSYQGAIRGSWAGATYGGFWQEVPATPGVTYTLSGWFWADNNWTNQAEQGFKIEFLTGENGGETFISSEEALFNDIGENWVQKSVSAVAPANAQWVRVVIWNNNVGDQGAFQFDDFSLVAEPGTVITLSSLPAGMARAMGLDRLSIRHAA